MYRFKLAYRHGGGEVEGFSASAFTPEAAKTKAISRVREKVAYTPHPFDPDKLIFSETGLTTDERKFVREDWKITDLE